MEHFLASGIDGFYVAGSTGEGFTMDFDERVALTTEVANTSQIMALRQALVLTLHLHAHPHSRARAHTHTHTHTTHTLRTQTHTHTHTHTHTLN